MRERGKKEGRESEGDKEEREMGGGGGRGKERKKRGECERTRGRKDRIKLQTGCTCKKALHLLQNNLWSLPNVCNCRKEAHLFTSVSTSKLPIRMYTSVLA